MNITKRQRELGNAYLRYARKREALGTVEDLAAKLGVSRARLQFCARLVRMEQDTRNGSGPKPPAEGGNNNA